MVRALFFSIIFSHLGSFKVSAQTITVAAASNSRYALTEISKLYEKETGITINTVFASSGKLTAQILNGAPYDIFISANKKYPGTLYERGNTIGEAKVLVKGPLILWSKISLNHENPFSELKSDKIKTIAIANPELAPYGLASLEVLKKAGIYETIRKKLIFAESIAQVNQHIYLKSVDAAITSKSIIYADKFASLSNWIDVDSSFYNPVVHYLVLIANTKQDNMQVVKEFAEYLYQAEAIEIFSKFGYSTSSLSDETLMHRRTQQGYE
ncbi:molybdate ABC transporter substrate-binding protein [Bacteroidota bacterium]